VAHGTTGDTSTTLRGKNIRNQLLCQPMAPVPDNLKAQVAAAPKEPGPNQCKIDFLNQTRLAPGSVCVNSHGQMDPIGRGLENYDIGGKYRRTEVNKPSCVIEGKGQLPTTAADGSRALEAFQGPAGLAQTLIEHEKDLLGRCMVTNFLRYALGREL